MADGIFCLLKSVKNKGMDKFVDFHKQLMQHNIDDVMSYKDFLKMFATDEETIAKINALWYCRIYLEYTTSGCRSQQARYSV